MQVSLPKRHVVPKHPDIVIPMHVAIEYITVTVPLLLQGIKKGGNEAVPEFL